ncbi:hypothetical protein SAMN04487821_14313 [Enterococcus malodoratus]|uniref:hypothetical protein n=1 Tax=Enterococcus malodoratus TaxID=71451 RepID=UPI0008C98474|nr:hypothetical protein [Enterococcus malodoratus]SET99995.1 hypothetical protein SAMN04487821_14313 [Enterococcus malodoratus]
MTISKQSKEAIQKKIVVYDTKKAEIANVHSELAAVKEKADQAPSIELIQELTNYERLCAVLEAKEQQLHQEYQEYVKANSGTVVAFGQQLLKKEMTSNKEVHTTFNRLREILEVAVQVAGELQGEYNQHQHSVLDELRSLKPYLDEEAPSAWRFPSPESNIHLLKESEISTLKNYYDSVCKGLAEQQR